MGGLQPKRRPNHGPRAIETTEKKMHNLKSTRLCAQKTVNICSRMAKPSLACLSGLALLLAFSSGCLEDIPGQSCTNGQCDPLKPTEHITPSPDSATLTLEKGDKGDIGDKGEQGDRGEKGDKGDKGDNGDTGEKGDVGDKGEQGNHGLDGVAGSQGGTGTAGQNATGCSVQNDQLGNVTITCGNGSSASFKVPVCGNGIAEAGEACDDGNAVDTDGCTAACAAVALAEPVKQRLFTVVKQEARVDAIEITQEQLAACTDADGCRLEIGLSGLGLSSGVIDQPSMAPSCRFFLDATTGNWSVSPHCTYTYQVVLDPYNAPNQSSHYSYYASDWHGSVGDQSTKTVLDHLNGCFFAEAPPHTSTGTNSEYRLEQDSSPSFYLFSADQSWWQHSLGACDGVSGSLCWDYRSSDRACYLIIND
jgi:cysteine-rich repeat protein